MAEHVAEKRARLQSSKTRWSGRIDDVLVTQPLISPRTEKCSKDSIRQWLFSVNENNSKPETIQDIPVRPLKRNGSSEDDLALGIEASLYGKPAVKTTQGLQRSYAARPYLPRWSSLTLAFSTPSGPLSVMDVLNLWQDDPEELLLDLGFGAEELDITVKIPARFINHQSKARGINIQLFLEAQKNRMDIENPDVRNRFRQLEVLQQVTTAFNSLVGGSAQVPEKPGVSPVSAETRERRKRVGMLLRKASKKSLSQAANAQDHQPLPAPLKGLSSGPDLPADPPHDKRSPVKRARQCLPESACLSPLVEEQSCVPESAEPLLTTPVPQCKSSGLRGVREAGNISSTQRGPGEPVESFELEEIHSFDEGSIAGSFTSPTDHSGSEPASLSHVSSCVVRTNSCQSDSSGFLEEPFVPTFSQHPSPGPELMKVLNAMSGESTDSQQKSVEQQETVELHSTDHSVSSERMLKDTESCEMQSNTDLAKKLTSGAYATESHLQDTDEADINIVQKETTEVYTLNSATLQDTGQVDNFLDVNVTSKDTAENITAQDTGDVDCLVNVNVAPKDYAKDCRTENITAQDTGDVDCLVNVNVTPKDYVKDCRTENITAQDTGQVDCLVDVIVAPKDTTEDYMSENITAQDTGEVDCLGDMNVDMKDYAKDFMTESTASQDTYRVESSRGINVAEEDIAAGYTWQSTTALEDSLGPPPDVIPQGDSLMDVLKSENTTFEMGSSPFDLEAGVGENKAASSSEPMERNSSGLYAGRSVSVQMRSSLSSVSKCSLRGGHSPSFGPTPPNSISLRRESFSHRDHSDANIGNFSDPLCSSTTPEEITPSPQLWHFQARPKGFRNLQMRSTSLDMGTSYEEDKPWEKMLWAGIQCCCSCDHNCRCCCRNKSGQKQHSGSMNHLQTASILPFSLDELDGMMRCMRKFRRVLSEIEERLQEEQTSVLNSLSDEHRAEVQDILELRAAVKQEAVLLEQQLTDLVHAYDDSIKMKLNRLLDEQSHLCSQLHITPSDRPHPAYTSTRSVAVQCCLLPVMDSTHSCLSPQPSSDTDFTRKTDKLDFVGFIKSLKDMTITNDSLE